MENLATSSCKSGGGVHHSDQPKEGSWCHSFSISSVHKGLKVSSSAAGGGAYSSGAVPLIVLFNHVDVPIMHMHCGSASFDLDILFNQFILFKGPARP